MDVKNSKNNNDENINVEELEELRLKSRRDSKLWFCFYFFICLGFAYIAGFFDKTSESINSDFDYILVIFGCVIFAYILGCGKAMGGKNYQKFSKDYKKIFVKSTFDKLFDEVHYDVENSINIDKVFDNIRNIGMLRIGNRIHNNDYICGKYKGVNFEYSDFVTSIKKDDDNTVLFAGQWLIFDFNKKFKFDFQVCEKDFKNSIIDENIFKKVELEDIEFNNLFNVYSQNELDTFYVLTPNIIEKLKDLNNKLKGSLLLCFVGNKLHVGLHSVDDFFERDVASEIDVNKESERVMNDLKVILSFIDVLNLDNRLFK